MDWEQATTNSTVPSGTKSAGWILDAAEVRDRYTDPTLMAMRVWGNARIAGTASSGGFFGVGVIAWSDPDGSAPSLAADIPGVFTNGDLDWIGRWVLPFHNGAPDNSVVTPVIFDLAHSLKAKRRLGQNLGLLVCHENLMATNTIQALFDWRMLIKA